MEYIISKGRAFFGYFAQMLSFSNLKNHRDRIVREKLFLQGEIVIYNTL